MDPKLEKWIRWFDVIKVEVQDLVVAKHTFNEVQGMIRANVKLHKHSSFYDHFARTYVSHVVIGLRRQIKRDAQSISLSRLFGEMIATPQSLPRTWFTAKYKGSVVQDLADDDFNKFATPGSPNIDPRLVESDLLRLQTATKRCEEFADRRVAHRDQREPKEVPTYQEVDECVELFDQLYVKYFLLFHQSSMDTLLPTWQYDWKEIFRVPWIEEQV
jgi:hypothetical protein